MKQDIQYAVRMLLRSPSFAIISFLALALGIGVTTTIFGIVNNILLKPLPVGNSERLVQVYTKDAKIGRWGCSFLNFEDLAKQNSVFTGLTAYVFAPMGLARGGETTNIFGQLVSGNYFSVLEVQPTLGRGFVANEDAAKNAYPVVVLSHRFWKKLGGDPQIVGTVLILNGRTFTVVGVAPASFTGTEVTVAPDLWVPMAMHEWVMPGNDWFQNRRALLLNVFGRLKPGVSGSQAQAELKTIASQLENAYPDANKERSIEIESLEQAKTRGIGEPGNENGAQQISVLLLAVAASVLLIACANVANLLLARATTRQREIAVRLALGAGRKRLVRQLLTESLLLALLGGLGGIVLAYWFGDILMSMLPPTPIPLSVDATPDWRVLVFAFVLAILSGVTFGLAPALQSTRADLTQGLRERASTSGGASRWNLRNLLVIGQIAVSLLLLISSGLFLKSFQQAQAINPGFRTQDLALLSIDLNLAGYDAARGKQIARTILDQVRTDARVRGADFAQAVPLGFGTVGRTVLVEGRDSSAEANRKFATVNAITPGYLDTLGIPLLRGRKFTEADCERPVAQSAIISEAMTRQFWPGEDALGRRFRFHGGEPMEVIGITRDVKVSSLGEAPQPLVYLPLNQPPAGGLTLFVHTTGPSAPVLKQAEAIVRGLDDKIPITYMKTVGDHLAFALWPSWMGAVLLGAFGVLALVLASMGVYGVMAYSVSQRTRELGIRMALGAQTGEVVQLVLRQGMTIAAVELGVGLLAAFAATRLVGALLYGVNPSDPVVFIGVTALLAISAFAACYFPARRAVKIDPVSALRFE